MDFDDISRVVPWIEMGRRVDIDLNAEQRGNPRGFKSHLEFDQLPKGQDTSMLFGTRSMLPTQHLSLWRAGFLR